MEYEAPEVPLVTSPVFGSITAESVGVTSKLNVPPVVPSIVTVPPSHVGATVKEASSEVVTVTF